jgi:hypothetical protein
MEDLKSCGTVGCRRDCLRDKSFAGARGLWFINNCRRITRLSGMVTEFDNMVKQKHAGDRGPG